MRHLVLKPRILRDVARVGAPAFATRFTDSLIPTVPNRVLGSYGSVAIAAYGITFHVVMLVSPLMTGVTHGPLSIVGRSFGTKSSTVGCGPPTGPPPRGPAAYPWR